MNVLHRHIDSTDIVGRLRLESLHLLIEDGLALVPLYSLLQLPHLLVIVHRSTIGLINMTELGRVSRVKRLLVGSDSLVFRLLA